MPVPFILDTADVSDFQEVVSTAGPDRCFRIVIVDDSDPEPAENFTVSFVVNKVQPQGVNVTIRQSEAVIIIQENDRKCHWCLTA